MSANGSQKVSTKFERVFEQLDQMKIDVAEMKVRNEIGEQQMKEIAAKVDLISAILCATLLAGCRSSDPTRSVEATGMYVNPATETVAIGKVEVVAAPSGEESAFIKYDEDYAWLSPSMKLHDVKVFLTGTNSTEQAKTIVKNICEAFIAVKPSGDTEGK